jgi:hypothetical protein
MPLKITNSENIKNSEKDLIDALTAEVDWKSLESIFRDKHGLRIQDDLEYKTGDIIVHDGQVAYKLDFEVKVSLSVIFDRSGDYVALQTDTAAAGLEAEDEVESETDTTKDDSAVVHGRDELRESELPTVDPDKDPEANIDQMTSELADMITDINKD